jgi:hypothetical protein
MARSLVTDGPWRRGLFVGFDRVSKSDGELRGNLTDDNYDINDVWDIEQRSTRQRQLRQLRQLHRLVTPALFECESIVLIELPPSRSRAMRRELGAGLARAETVNR